METKKPMFKEIVDVDKNKKLIPLSATGSVFLYTHDNKFFIYALYTKEDYTNSELIEISIDEYFNIKKEFIKLFGTQLIECSGDKKQDLTSMINLVEYKSIADLLDLEDYMKLVGVRNEKND